MIDLTNNIGPYMGISANSRIDFPEVELSFQVVVYGAFNAMGLIGSEGNGIAIFEITRGYVVLDEHCKTSSGWYGPTRTQLEEFNRIAGLEWEDFRAFVSGHKRSRWAYGPEGVPTGKPMPW